MKSLQELSDEPTNITAWVPADIYADLIIEASVCYGQLSGVVTAIDYNMGVGEGGTIQVQYVPARTAQGPLTEFQCLSETSSTLGTYPISVAKYGDYDKLPGITLFKAKGPVKDAILNEMAKGLANVRDTQIYTQLSQVIPGYTSTTNVAWAASSATVANSGCCYNGFDIYNALIQLQKTMQANAIEPDYVLIDPRISAHLYYKDNGNMPDASLQMPLLKFTSDGGKVASIAGMKVIETCVASDFGGTHNAVFSWPSDRSGATVAIVIDSKRAVGEAWGKRPTFHEFYEIDCDWYKETVWMYWGCSDMDLNAIGHVVNV